MDGALRLYTRPGGDNLGSRKAGSLFVVMTLQKGDAPEVKVEGTGLDAKVAVGRQVISFDGEKIVLVQ